MKKGKVILAGAGPGDPELITLKAARYLQAADIIITDRLVSAELLEQYAHPEATILSVGKEGNASGSTPQSAINELLVDCYAPGKLVVRLKGGDVAFFSNVLDELTTLAEHNIPFEIVPGITAASGASAYAGIPLTARGYSKSVRFLTYYQHENWTATHWSELAHTTDTLVLYMSACKLSLFAHNLIKHGAAPDKLLAIVEQATTPFQKVNTQTLCSASILNKEYVSPSLVIVGDVVALHEQFDWFETSGNGRYFAPAAHMSYKKKLTTMLDKTRQQHFGELVAASSFEELIWMNGFLSGALVRHKGGKSFAQPTEQTSIPVLAPLKITIAFGTETGNAKSLAGKLSALAKKEGVVVKTVSLDQFRPADLVKEQTLLFIVSTQGDGEPPAAAQKFFDFINSHDVQLSQLRYGVIGLGDTAYPLFCQAGKDLDRKLSELGALRIATAQLCDTDYEEASIRWMELALKTLRHSNIGEPATVSATAATSAQKKNLSGKVLRNIPLNDRGSEKQIHHIEIAAEGIIYEPGDSLGIVPKNPSPLIAAVIERTGAPADMVITYRNEALTLDSLLAQKVNITCLPPRIVKRYAAIVGQDIPEVKIGLLDLLSIYPVKDVSQLKDVLAELEPITPRLYSISSAPAAHEGEVHITVKRDEFFLEEDKRYGLCSDFLSSLSVGAELSFYIHANKRFRLPRPEADLIMIGAGTGIAPFRSFLAERAAQGATGNSWLFFGEQRFASDFLYQTEWQSHLESGVLTKINTAFSRDQKEKIYVQHKLRKHGAEVYDWLQRGASLYVCGAREPMSLDVERALLEILSEHGSKSTSASQAYLQELVESGRYQKDVY